MKPNGNMHFASYYRWLVIRNWVRINPADRVLDVGCDDGEIIARIPAALKVGLDLNPRSPDPNVRLLCGDARCLPIPSGKFDAVFAFDIIEHIDNDRAVLAELVRVLADDGTLWISTPSAGFFIFPRFLTERANRGWGHIRNGYTVESLIAKLPAATMIETIPWNEPVLRFMHVPLRVLDEISSAMTCALAWLCFQIDKYLLNGFNGHLFIRVRKLIIH